MNTPEERIRMIKIIGKIHSLENFAAKCGIADTSYMLPAASDRKIKKDSIIKSVK